MKKTDEIYRGKAKTVYGCEQPDRFIMHYRDDVTAFDATKKASLTRKGLVNNHFNAFIMQRLEEAGIATHFEGLLSDQESLVKRMDMIPVECVVRNVATGSLCRRLGIEEGLILEPPVFEFFYKDDSLHDPMINEYHVVTFNYASKDEIEQMKALTFKVNTILQPLFKDAGFTLVDYKLEFGRYQGQLLLGDEFTPDGCRLWDADSGEKFDKDRFRQDLGNVIEAYEVVAKRLGISLP